MGEQGTWMMALCNHCNSTEIQFQSTHILSLPSVNVIPVSPFKTDSTPFLSSNTDVPLSPFHTLDNTCDEMAARVWQIPKMATIL